MIRGRVVDLLRRMGRRLPGDAQRLVFGPGRAAQGWWDEFVDRFNALDLSENALLLGFAVIVGVAGGGGVILFYRLIDLVYHVFFRLPSEWFPPIVPLLSRPVVTALAFLAAWSLMRRFAPGETGMTVPDVRRRVMREGGEIPARPALARTAASAVTLGGGGSVGSEGPVAVLGAATGSLVARLFRFGADRKTLLVACGAAAAISAAFNAPLAGAFFALEEVLGGLSIASFPVVIVASVVAAVISRSVFGNHPAFPLPVEYGYGHASEVVVAYPVLGVVVGLVAVLFIRTYFRVSTIRLTTARVLAIGALVGALVSLSDGRLVGTGHLAIPIDVFGTIAWWSIALLVIGKIVVTSLTLAGGGSGGVFTPALYIGAATGGAWGAALGAVLPGAGIQAGAYAVVGMGAMVAAATGAPITGILLVFEMTDDYAIMLPLMMTTAIAVVVARHLSADDLYSGWLRRRGIVLEHGGDREVLAGLTVGDAMDPGAIVIADTADLATLRHTLAFSSQTVFPVIDNDGVLIGVFALAELGASRPEHRTARDLAQVTEAVTAAAPLVDVARRLGALGVAALPVVDGSDGRVRGLITRSGILARYHTSGAAAPA